MTKLHLPHWHRPEDLSPILLGLPENRRNRAPYLLAQQFDYDRTPHQPAAPILLAALRLL